MGVLEIRCGKFSYILLGHKGDQSRTSLNTVKNFLYFADRAFQYIYLSN